MQESLSIYPHYLAAADNTKQAEERRQAAKELADAEREHQLAAQEKLAATSPGNAKLQLYISAACGYCQRAKTLLDSHNVRYEVVIVDADLEKQRWIVAKSGRKVLPQLFVNDRHLGGFFELRRMSEQGSLEILLFR